MTTTPFQQQKCELTGDKQKHVLEISELFLDNSNVLKMKNKENASSQPDISPCILERKETISLENESICVEENETYLTCPQYGSQDQT